MEIEMKKIVALALAVATLAMCAMLSSCGLVETGDVEVAIITDGGNVGESSMNQAVVIAAAKFAIAHDKTHDVYHPISQSQEDLVDSIMQAVINGAKVVVCSGQLLESAVYEVEDLFPDVRFLLVDGVPKGIEKASVLVAATNNANKQEGTAEESADKAAETTAPTKQTKISKNVFCITFHEEQAGYLAGYVSVRDGYTKFGFISEKDSEADMLYASGFLQGIQDAAREMGMIDRINVKFRYSGTTDTHDEVKSAVESWIIAGTEMVFASGNTCVPVIAAAEAQNGRVICTDSDHSKASDLVVNSAMKFVEKPITEALDSLYNNGLKWDKQHAGVSLECGVAESGVGLNTAAAAWRFGNYGIDAYENIVARIVAGEIKVDNTGNILQNHEIAIDFFS